MPRCCWLLALLFGPLACQPIVYEDSSSVTDAEPTSVVGIPVPQPGSVREPYTSYLEVKSGDQVVGYLLRFDPIPMHVQGVRRSAPEGTVWVEDSTFRRIGFITPNGKAYRFRGGLEEELGQGPQQTILPLYFGTYDLTVQPLH